MVDEFVSSPDADEGVKAWYLESRRDNKLVPLASTAAKLVGLVEAGKFESGSHIDYFDAEP